MLFSRFDNANCTTSACRAAWTLVNGDTQLAGKNTFGNVAQGSGAGQYCTIYHLVIAR